MGCSSLNDTPILAKKKAPEPARRRRRRRTQNSADPTKLLGPKGPKSHIILSHDNKDSVIVPIIIYLDVLDKKILNAIGFCFLVETS